MDGNSGFHTHNVNTSSAVIHLLLQEHKVWGGIPLWILTPPHVKRGLRFYNKQNNSEHAQTARVPRGESRKGLVQDLGGIVGRDRHLRDPRVRLGLAVRRPVFFHLQLAVWTLTGQHKGERRQRYSPTAETSGLCTENMLTGKSSFYTDNCTLKFK